MNPLMARRISAGAVALSLLAGGGVLAGCGSSSSSSEGTGTRAAASASAETANGVAELPAKEILARSLAASKAATSVTVKGTLTEEGTETSLDLVMGTDASEGTFTTEGVELSTVFVDGASYFKASGDGWATLLGSAGAEGRALGKEIASLIGDRWVKLPAEPGSADEAGGLLGVLLATLGELLQKDSFLTGVLQPDSALTVRGTGDVNGTPVVFLEDATAEGTLAIQTVGEPYPIQISGDAASSGSGIIFSDWSAPVSVTAPTDVVDIGELAKLSG